MILNVFAFKNKKIECFTQPFFSDVDPEKFAINTKRSVFASEDLEKIVPYKNLTLYIIGVFNDETGEIILNDEAGNPIMRKLYDCSVDVLGILAKAKGVTVDEVESVRIER